MQSDTAIDEIWSEDPQYPVSEWQLEVANDITRLGYWNWVEHRKEANQDETFD